MKGEYRNWMPKRLPRAVILGALLFAGLSYYFGKLMARGTMYTVFSLLFSVIALVLLFLFFKFQYMEKAFDFSNAHSLSWKIIFYLAEQLNIQQEDAKVIDIGCGSGALTLTLAKKFTHAQVTGVDTWGRGYKGEFSKDLCESNARAEGVSNAQFIVGDAKHLEFADESFDVLVSNYVYHNIPADRNQLIKESLRVVKKGGQFVIHDVFSKAKYPKLDELLEELNHGGYQCELRDTTDGEPMTPDIAKKTMLTGSKLLVGTRLETADRHL